MSPLLRFRKSQEKKNTFYDEYFFDADEIEIIQFNFDGRGSMLCRADGKLRTVSEGATTLILFGEERAQLERYLRGIFDPAARTAEFSGFRLEELNALPEEDLKNLAKRTRKELLGDGEGEGEGDLEGTFVYFEEVTPEALAGRASGAEPGNFSGNANSKVFHSSECNFGKGASGAVSFREREEAIAAGFRPCTICNP